MQSDKVYVAIFWEVGCAEDISLYPYNYFDLGINLKIVGNNDSV